jgi:hypothetical protein
MKPFIVLAFANDKDNYLPMIVRESKNIYKTLQTHHDNGYVQVHKEENTSVGDIFELFNRYRERIAIFHYGGHAGGTHLQLETGTGEPQPAHAQGLARLLGQEEKLQLVFLNGCATLKQVDLLLEAGVGAVIATSVPIEDKAATEFAEQFYFALAGGASIQKAFDTAKAFIATRYGPSRAINRFPYRRPNLETTEQAGEKFPWGLYFDETRPEVLGWKLPTTNRDWIRIHGTRVPTGAGVKVNAGLMETLLNEMTAYGVEKPGKPDWRLMRAAVIDGFPVPVGEQLRLLFHSSSIDVQRLKQLMTTYQTTMELLCFTLLSQLWDAQMEKENEHRQLVIHEDYLTVFNSFFALGPDSYATFDYVKLTAALLGIFQANHINYFIAELSTLEKALGAEEEFYRACLFMEEMKKETLDGGVKADEMESLCVQGEAHLGTVLKKLAFFVNYRMTTVKTIEVIKPRHKKATFYHNKVTLDRVTQGLADEGAEFDRFTDNNSVIFLENSGDVAEYLSLSPFIIDQNALTGHECSKLFFYSHREVKEGTWCYVYKFIDNGMETLMVSDAKYPEIKEQMEEFKERTLCLPVT